MASMKIVCVTMIALASGTTVSAASDPGLSVPGSVFQRPNSGGVGAQMGVRIKLGTDDQVKDVDRVALGIAAGPLMTVRDARMPGGFRQNIAPIAGFTLNPGFGAQAKLMGQPVLQYHTRFGLAEQAKQDAKIDPKQKQGISTLGVVGIVAGVAVVGYLGLVAFICRDGCSE